MLIATLDTHIDLDDAQLLTLLNEQNSDSFAQIFQKYWQELYDFAYLKTQDVDASEEIVQELFVQLWEKRKTLRIANLRSYLFVSVKNRVIDHYRQTTHARLDSIADLPSDTPYPLFLEELESAIGDALAQLPEKSQQIFRLKKFEDKTTREIAEMLAMPERTVEYHYTQAARTLKILLSGFLSLLIWLFSSSTF
ncbi:RNA polymerase sigma-70 factor [Persicitalea sp.]|uniref:RNA polymerase sigma-70 factor n=1 Tax=Persicitalea sp. TaxID=3100273 RepID=UPI00359397E6